LTENYYYSTFKPDNLLLGDEVSLNQNLSQESMVTLPQPSTSMDNLSNNEPIEPSYNTFLPNLDLDTEYESGFEILIEKMSKAIFKMNEFVTFLLFFFFLLGHRIYHALDLLLGVLNLTTHLKLENRR
jgi:hypothetical protein